MAISRGEGAREWVKREAILDWLKCNEINDLPVEGFCLGTKVPRHSAKGDYL